MLKASADGAKIAFDDTTKVTTRLVLDFEGSRLSGAFVLSQGGKSS